MAKKMYYVFVCYVAFEITLEGRTWTILDVEYSSSFKIIYAFHSHFLQSNYSREIINDVFNTETEFLCLALLMTILSHP